MVPRRLQYWGPPWGWVFEVPALAARRFSGCLNGAAACTSGAVPPQYWLPRVCWAQRKDACCGGSSSSPITDCPLSWAETRLWQTAGL